MFRKRKKLKDLSPLQTIENEVLPVLSYYKNFEVNGKYFILEDSIQYNKTNC